MTKTPRTVWDRLSEALEEAGLPATQEQAAKIAGVKQPSVSLWKSGGYPTLENAVALARRLNVCVEWIYTERQPKRPAGPPTDPIAAELWDYWGRLPQEAKRELLGYAKVEARKSARPSTASKSRVAR